MYDMCNDKPVDIGDLGEGERSTASAGSALVMMAKELNIK